MELAVDNFVRGNLLRLSVDNKLNAFSPSSALSCYK